MALPSPNLDDRRFQQLVDDAKRHVQRRAPEWTDHNVSDPGVTLIEAVAHMTDQLVYRLNRVPDKNYLAFLDLLGVRLFPPSAAVVDVTFWLSAPQPEPVLLPAGTEVATESTGTEDAVVFATEHDVVVPPAALAHVLCRNADGTAQDRTADVLGGVDVPVFAAVPQPGDMLLLGLSGAVPSAVLVLDLDSRVDGVGVDPRKPPLRWEAATSEGWLPCEVEEDTTGGLNRTGEVVLHVPAAHAPTTLDGQDAGWLRCRTVAPAAGQPFYSTSPTLRAASAYTIGATGRAVHATEERDEPLGELDGVPGQRLRLARPPVVAGDPPLLLEVSAGFGWQPWTVVESFSASGPQDRHVILDATTGEITFGPAVRQPDGTLRQYGAVPPAGSVVRAVRYRSGGGRSGNVPRGAVRVLRSSLPSVDRVENREAAVGGVDGETVAEAAVRAPVMLRAQDRAVTVRDFEELARQAAPEAARIACLGADPEEVGQNAVRLLVVPQVVPDLRGRLRFEQLVPGDDLLERITRYLDERRPLGTRLSIGPPYYQGVTVTAVVRVQRAARQGGRVQAAVLDALYAYLDPLTGGADGGGWPFGRSLRAGEIFSTLQRVPGVDLVDTVTLNAVDPLTGRRGEVTDRLELSAAALFYSFEHTARVVT